MKYVISLGGSIIVPDQIDTKFLKKFVAFISAQTRAGNSFEIIVGGGKTCRLYQQAAIDSNFLPKKTRSIDLDLIGIASTKLNAELLRVLFRKNNNVQIHAGEKPGFSTDGIAVKVARRTHANTVVNLFDVDFVYDSDPKKNKKATGFTNLSWSQYLALFRAKRVPGGHYPFDPMAAKLAQNSGLKVVVLNGRNLPNFQAFLTGKPFRGSTIQ